MKMRTKQAERGMAVVAATVMLVLLIPVTGLAIDVTLLYVDKARLQGAVDGAALAGAEGLARGDNDAAQQTSARQAAAEYVFLNYPSTFFFTNSITVNQATDVTIDETVANQRTVSVTAHANVPTLFMRWLKFTSTNVNASATVTRRDVNIVMVVDRSNSLQVSGSCGAVIQAATNFVNKFSNGSDNVGLVTFASSTNADFPIANNFLAASSTLPAPAQTVPQLLGNISCLGSTSSAMALWTGYDQLVGLNQPNALNVILFFTDGIPTGVNVNMPYDATQHTCSHAHPASGSNAPYINGLYNTFTGQNQYFGVLNPVNGGSVTNSDFNITPDGQSGAGCAFAQGWSGGSGPNDTNTSDFLGVPQHDLFGDNLNNGYLPITLTGMIGAYGPFISLNLSGNSNAANMPQNAMDDAATQIRTGTVEPVSATGLLNNIGKGLNGVTIYSIGLGNAVNGTVNPASLIRVSNTTASPIFVAPPTQQTGDFVLAPTSADINSAFSQIAAEILRIAK
jgi:hypothetical protein